VIIAGLFTGAIVVHLRLPEKMPLNGAPFEPLLALGVLPFDAPAAFN